MSPGWNGVDIQIHGNWTLSPTLDRNDHALTAFLTPHGNRFLRVCRVFRLWVFVWLGAFVFLLGFCAALYGRPFLPENKQLYYNRNIRNIFFKRIKMMGKCWEIKPSCLLKGHPLICLILKFLTVLKSWKKVKFLTWFKLHLLTMHQFFPGIDELPQHSKDTHFDFDFIFWLSINHILTDMWNIVQK